MPPPAEGPADAAGGLGDECEGRDSFFRLSLRTSRDPPCSVEKSLCVGMCLGLCRNVGMWQIK